MTKLFNHTLKTLENIVHELESLLLVEDFTKALGDKTDGDYSLEFGEYYQLQISMHKAFAALEAIFRIDDESKYPMFKLDEDNLSTEEWAEKKVKAEAQAEANARHIR